MINNICANCIHEEVCGWCDSITQDACDFYEDDGDWIKADVLQKIREEIAQIKATKIYSTIDLKDMVLAIIDKHMEEHHD